MPSTKIQAVFAGRPTFPASEVVVEMFDQIFALSQEDAEPDQEIASALVELIDLHSNVSSSMDLRIGEQLTTWVTNHWASEPSAFVEDLCRLLVNSRTDQSLEFLRMKLVETVSPMERETIELSIKCHSRSKQPKSDVQ